MPNLYGVAVPNPLPQFAQTIGGIDVNIPFGTETNFVSQAPPSVVSPGVYYPGAWGTVAFSLGATVPTAINWSLRINNGSDLAQQFTNNLILVPSANLELSVFLYGYGLILNNPLATTTFQVSATCNVANITIRTAGTQFTLQWLRAPDQ